MIHGGFGEASYYLRRSKVGCLIVAPAPANTEALRKRPLNRSSSFSNCEASGPAPIADGFQISRALSDRDLQAASTTNSRPTWRTIIKPF